MIYLPLGMMVRLKDKVKVKFTREMVDIFVLFVLTDEREAFNRDD